MESSNWKQLIIARKDLGMSPGKLAAQVAHGSMAFLTAQIKRNAVCSDKTKYPVTKTPYMYRHPDLYNLAIAAHQEGKEWFHTRKNEDGRIIPCEPDPWYVATLEFKADLYEGWIQGSFTKVVCEAKNRDHLLKATKIAEDMGLRPEVDFFFIRDNCLTELEPEDEDGRTLTVVGFRPLPAEVCAKISRKFQLYR